MPQDLEQVYKQKSGTQLMLHREVTEIVRAYRHPWDVLAELLQNSFDAVRRQFLNDGGKDYHPQIDITIDTHAKSITIKDNGCGMSPDQLVMALLPSGTFKRMGHDYGYKGYGLTFVAFISSHFVLTSVRDGMQSSLSMADNILWTTQNQSVVSTYPQINWHQEAQSVDLPNGTSVVVTLDYEKYEIRSRLIPPHAMIFEWANSLKRLEYVLRTRTAIGTTEPLFNRSPSPQIRTRATVDDQSSEIRYSFLSPAESYHVSQEYQHDIETYAKRVAKALISLEAKKYRGLRYVATGLAAGTRRPVPYDLYILVCGRTGTTALAREYDVDDKQDPWDLKIDTGIYLSINGMPTGIKLSDLSSIGGFYQRFFIIANVDLAVSDELDPGRKGISETTRENITRHALNHIRRHVVGVNKETLFQFAQLWRSTDPEIEDYSSGDRVRQRESIPLLPLEGLSIVREPNDENELIALFYELIGRRLLPGYETKYLSQSDKYDAAYSYSVELGDDVLYPKHRLGLGDLARSRFRDGATAYNWQNQQGIEWFVAEFKLAAQDLLASQRQSLSGIELLICWDADLGAVESYGGLLTELPGHQRRLFGVTHILRSSEGHECRCMVMRAVVDELAVRVRGEL